MKFIGRKLPFVILAVALFLGLHNVSFSANAETLPSGNPAMSKPTKEQIAEMYNTVTDITSLYDERPSVVAPYAAGKLSDSALQGSLSLLNYIRYVANLPELELDDELNNIAQCGAVVMAANNTLTHRPVKPAGMDDTFYQNGYSATTSSNISYAWGYDPLSTLFVGIEGCMDDSDPHNADSLGHRRWFLNPSLKYVGIGHAESADGSHYSAYRVFDTSAAYFDYDYVSWPASGNMPTNLFSYDTPWSISLDVYSYAYAQRDNITITLTRESDGKVWTFDKNTAAYCNGTDAYMRVCHQRYGVDNCIIFRPDYSTKEQYEGVYTVQVTGLKDNQGTSCTLEFSVDFFDVDSVGVAEGWTQENEKWYYYSDGDAVVDWKQINGIWYYFDNQGVMQTGWVHDGRNWYYMGSSGAMQTNWQYVSGKWYYFNASGIMQTGWKQIGGAWYYFNASGIMQTGWLRQSNSWYYLNNSGIMQTGWLQQGNSWYYLNNSGAMVTGMVTINGKQHSFNSSGIWLGEISRNGWAKEGGKWVYYQNGAKATGWKQINGVWYYFSSQGIMQTGWVYYGKSWYYMSSSGAMQTGWLKDGGTWYYFKDSGAMVTGSVKIGNMTYQFNASGACLNP